MTITLGQSAANQSAVTFAGRNRRNKKAKETAKFPYQDIGRKAQGKSVEDLLSEEPDTFTFGKDVRLQPKGKGKKQSKSGLKAQQQQEKEKAKTKEKLVSEDELTDEELQTDGEVHTDDELESVDETQGKDSAKDVTANKSDKSNTPPTKEEESTVLGTIFNVVTAPIRWIYSAVTGILGWVAGLFGGGEK